ncbi:MAG: chemotaxis protein CheX [Deltaproteobacteria bacterium]|nr:chemotaxis protein CheX [Deltaproteobacteria bacterium]
MSAPKPEIVDALVGAVVRVIQISLGENAQQIATSYASDVDPAPSIAVSISLSGSLRGPVTWSFSRQLARRVTESMMMGPAPEEYYAGAVAELANMMLGNAVASLEDAGFLVELAPPLIAPERKQGARNALVVAITVPSGEIKLLFDLEEAA